MSLLFVFAAMAEFAFVLLVKRRQEWQNVAEYCQFNEVNSGEPDGRQINEVFNALHNADPQERTLGSVQNTVDQEKRYISVWSTKCAILHRLPFITKIDFAGLVLFYFSYLIYNVFYWIRVLYLVY